MIDADIRQRFAEAARDPARRQFFEDLYVTGDPIGDARRFFESAEFRAVHEILGARLIGAEVADVGAGTGVATYALARAGAARVHAIEPEAGELGRDAIARATAGLPVEIEAAVAEQLPLDDATVDIVYCRQVLHHAADLTVFVRKVRASSNPAAHCSPAVSPFTVSAATRDGEGEHEWLHEGERAYRPSEYGEAFEAAGLELNVTIGHWDSVINAYPAVYSEEELDMYPSARLAHIDRPAVSPRCQASSGSSSRSPGVPMCGQRARRLRRDKT